MLKKTAHVPKKEKTHELLGLVRFVTYKSLAVSKKKKIINSNNFIAMVTIQSAVTRQKYYLITMFSLPYVVTEKFYFSFFFIIIFLC